jgi:hypothetical protein
MRGSLFSAAPGGELVFAGADFAGGELVSVIPPLRFWRKIILWFKALR